MHLKPQALLATSLAHQTTATTLFVSSYAGTVTTLSLTNNSGSYDLSQISASTECAPNPSWLTLDYANSTLFCLNEGLETLNGSLSSFTINADGSLKHVQNTTTLSGPVAGVIYTGRDESAIALAHYSGHAVSSWLLDGDGTFSLNEIIGPFTLAKTGPVASRQDAPYEHEAITDPTGRYVLVPDLGADLVRVFTINQTTLDLVQLAPLVAAPGSGPRHAVFYTPDTTGWQTWSNPQSSNNEANGGTHGKTFLYIANELGQTITGYSVTYLPYWSGLSFTPIFNSSTYGSNPHPSSLAPSEIRISPDNRFLLVGNRNSSTITVSNPDPTNSTEIQSDTISTFKFDQDGSGALELVQIAPVYGSFPRNFALDRTGELVGVGLQESSRVVVLERDVTSGLLGGLAATVPIEGQVTCVVFNEEPYNDGMGDGR